MRRGRAAVGAAIAAIAAAALAGCDSGGRRPGVVGANGTSAADAGTPRATKCVIPEPTEVDAASVLVPGPTNGLPLSTAPGEKLTIEAVVIDAACKAAEGASVNLWHTDGRGRYGPEGTDACCYYQSMGHTDHNGRFRVETIRPGRYSQASAPPAHIHLEIQHPSGRLTTEIVFTTGPAPTVAQGADGTVPVVLSSVTGAQGQVWYGHATFGLKP